MKLHKENLGKVAITIDKDYWDSHKDYDKLVVVQVKDAFATYVSRKPVPAGTMTTDREYWIPFSSLKEDIVLDYNSFKEKYGEELAFLHDSVDRMDEIMRASENIMETHDKIKEDADYIKDVFDNVLNDGSILTYRHWFPGSSPTAVYPFIDWNDEGVTITFDYANRNGTGRYKTAIMGLAGGSLKIAPYTYHFSNGLVTRDERALLVNKNQANGVVVLNDSNFIPNEFLNYELVNGNPVDAEYLLKTWHSLGLNVNALETNHWLYTRVHESADHNKGLSFDMNYAVALNEAITYTANTVKGLGRVITNMGAILGIRDIVNPLAWDFTMESPQAAMQIAGTYVKSDMTTKRAITVLDKNAADRSAEIKQLRADVPGIVDEKIAKIVGSAPETLDTLEEIANKLHDNDDIHQAILAAIGEKVSNTTYNDYITRAEAAMNTMNDKIAELEGKLLVIETNSKLSLGGTPTCLYKNIASNITVTVNFTNDTGVVPTKITIQGKTTNKEIQNSKTGSLAETITLDTNTFIYTANCEVNGATLNTKWILNARHPVYAGFGSSANDVAVVGNRLAPTITARLTYDKTANVAGNFFILVPNDVTAPTSFTMGGAPYVMTKTTETINGISYNVFKSGASYASGTNLTITSN